MGGVEAYTGRAGGVRIGVLRTDLGSRFCKLIACLIKTYSRVQVQVQKFVILIGPDELEMFFLV